MLRIAFAGTPEFAVPTLRALADSGHALVGVLTQPDRPAGRGRELRASPVKQLALMLGVPVAQPARLKSPAEQAALEAWQPEVLIVAAYGLILPPAVLSLPRLGCINVHASLLPRWRGAAPIQRAILAGDVSSGVTIMQMDAGLDTGAILLQQPLAIGTAMSAAELQAALAQQGAALLMEALDRLRAGRLAAQAQPEEGATYAAKISKAEARIDWQADAGQLARQVRAFNPWPVAHTLWRGEPLRIWEAQETDSAPAAAPGEILQLERDRLLVSCGTGVLAIGRLQQAGRRIVSAREFASGQDLAGARFE